MESWIERWQLNEKMRWRPALLHAGLIVTVILSLFYYWFAVADRYQIFLYNHLGATPFDSVTRSRYWMAGLVASGIVLVGYTPLNWLLAQTALATGRGCRPPIWWQVWLLALIPLGIGVPLITMNLNQPALPLSDALLVLLATLAGLLLALLPTAFTTSRPAALAWFLLDGSGLVPVLLLTRALELPSRGLIGTPAAIGVAVGGFLASSLWLSLMTGLQLWRQQLTQAPDKILVSGLCLSYLLLPLVHHLLFTPSDYRYISTASNFFAFHFGLQLLTFLLALLLALGITAWRRILYNQSGSS